MTNETTYQRGEGTDAADAAPGERPVALFRAVLERFARAAPDRGRRVLVLTIDELPILGTGKLDLRKVKEVALAADT